MLLAIVSLHAFDGHVLWRHSAPDAARGWAMLAAVLLFLSFDEVASVHERLGALGKALSMGSGRCSYRSGPCWRPCRCAR